MINKIFLSILSVLFVSTTCFAVNINTVIEKIKQKETRMEGMREIESIGHSALPYIKSLAKDKKKPSKERTIAIVLLGKVAKNISAENTKKQLSEGEDSGQTNKAEVSILLKEILQNDDDRFAREASALALGILKDKKNVPVLKKALRDKNRNVRMRAALGLAKMGDIAGKKPALKILKEKNVTAKFLAVDVLEEYNDKSVISKLKQNLDSKDVWTRIYSQLAIKKIELKNIEKKERLEYLKNALKEKQHEINKWAVKELSKDIVHNTQYRKQALEILKQTAKNEKMAGAYSSKKMLKHLIKKGTISKTHLK